MDTRWLFSLLVVGVAAATVAADEPVTPLPLPKTVRVESAEPRGKVWERLTPRQKRLAYHLTAAGRAGRDLLFYQTHRHALAIKHLLEEALSAEHLLDTKALLGEKPFAELLLYAAKFLDQCGPYASSNRKYLLREVKPDQVEQLLARHAAPVDAQARSDIVRLLTDPSYEVQLYPENPEGAGLERTGGNYYEKGITGQEIRRVLDKTLKPSLNGRVVRSGKDLTCQVQTTATPGVVGERLRQVVAELEAARAYSETAHQKAQIEHLINYFQGGDVEDFRQASIDWVRNRSDSRVDFMIGWVEFEGDWLVRMATWESYVQIVDPEISRLAQALARHAQYFEDHMPYGAFRKKFPPDYSPPAIMVYYFLEIASGRTGGYNLPNFDDIRRDVGAKNVIRLPLPGEDTDPQLWAMRRAALREFLPAAKVEPRSLIRLIRPKERCEQPDTESPLLAGPLPYGLYGVGLPPGAAARISWVCMTRRSS
jgi:dipeptidyl-peptidase III